MENQNQHNPQHRRQGQTLRSVPGAQKLPSEPPVGEAQAERVWAALGGINRLSLRGGAPGSRQGQQIRALQKPDRDLALDPLEIAVLRDQSQAMVLGQSKLIRIIEIQTEVFVGM